jgi:hypothetical protein
LKNATHAIVDYNGGPGFNTPYPWIFQTGPARKGHVMKALMLGFERVD